MGTSFCVRPGRQRITTPAEKHAAQASRRGGTHATTLGGMIFWNKDKKKGQQNTYDWYMQHHIGHPVPYPDVSNTRYGSHGEAAGVLIVYRTHFLRFMEHIRDAKEKPGFTNIEKNFYMAIQDNPTLTELCALAAHNVCVSRLFMKYVRRHENILDLQDFFEKKKQLLEAVSTDPKLWTGRDIKHKTAVLDGQEWMEWERTVMATIYTESASLPDLDWAVTKFAKGCKLTFGEWFSDEFLEGGDIDLLSENERRSLFFASTNDRNEGGLGTWRGAQKPRPAETIHRITSICAKSPGRPMQVAYKSRSKMHK